LHYFDDHFKINIPTKRRMAEELPMMFGVDEAERLDFDNLYGGNAMGQNDAFSGDILFALPPGPAREDAQEQHHYMGLDLGSNFDPDIFLAEMGQRTTDTEPEKYMESTVTNTTGCSAGNNILTEAMHEVMPPTKKVKVESTKEEMTQAQEKKPQAHEEVLKICLTATTLLPCMPATDSPSTAPTNNMTTSAPATFHFTHITSDVLAAIPTKATPAVNMTNTKQIGDGGAIKCDICNQECLSKRALAAHSKKHMSKCVVKGCDYKAHPGQAMGDHVQTHFLKGKVYVCAICYMKQETKVSAIYHACRHDQNQEAAAHLMESIICPEGGALTQLD
jgi:hypothetical protein